MTALIAGLAVLPVGALPQDRWADADAAVVRLAPAVFLELPDLLVAYLETRGCTIPQPTDIAERSNVVRGEFLSAGTPAWAVLCSIDNISRVLVFDSEQHLAAELGEVADRSYLQGAGPDGIVYSRRLAAATPAHIGRHYEESGDPTEELPEITHDGIEDAFLEKASHIYFFTGSEWIMLPGAN